MLACPASWHILLRDKWWLPLLGCVKYSDIKEAKVNWVPCIPIVRPGIGLPRRRCAAVRGLIRDLDKPERPPIFYLMGWPWVDVQLSWVPVLSSVT